MTRCARCLCETCLCVGAGRVTIGPRKSAPPIGGNVPTVEQRLDAIESTLARITDELRALKDRFPGHKL